jgi:hypothetical protein
MTNELFNRLAFAVSDIDFSICQLKRHYESKSTPEKEKNGETKELLHALVTDVKTIEANLKEIISKMS